MSEDLVVRRIFHVERVKQGRKLLQNGEAPGPVAAIPRIARLMALAIRFDTLLRDGTVASQAEVARLGHVTRSRLSQIMNLTLLAPDIQEALLFLSLADSRPIWLAQLQPIAVIADWRLQRRLWFQLIAKPKA
jgi:predicted XRE-type DNA-binding protein